MDTALFDIFRMEATDAVDKLALHLDALRAGDGDPASTLRLILRILHNVKGAARMVGVEGVAEVVHEVEEVLGPYRDVGQAPPTQVLGFVERGLGIIEGSIDGREQAAEAHALIASLQAIQSDVLLAEQGASEAPAALPSALPPAPAPAAPPPASAVPAPAAAPAPPAAKRSGTSSALAEPAGANIRVDVERLDSLMGLTGELLVIHARQTRRHEGLAQFGVGLTEAVKRLSHDQRHHLSEVVREFEALVRVDRRELHDLGYLTDEMSDAMKRLRMMPLDSVVPQWRKILREAVRESGKSSNLSVSVSGIELDKRILDGLRDPIMHLLRNAIAHGIEPVKTRTAKGKPAEGCVTIAARMLGARVCLEVSDDGGGFDLHTLSQKAVRKGLISAQTAASASREELRELVFLPGLSTVDAVTSLAGRGVGLDVVRARLQEMGGTVEIAEGAGVVGTTFRVLVPVSLVSTRGLLARVGDAILALPIDHVERVLRVPTAKLEAVAGGSAVRLGDQKPIMVWWLGTLLGLQRSPDPTYLTLILATHLNARMAIVVDEVIGEKEFVTKPLPWNLEHVPGANGAIVLGDGRLAVVVDVVHIFNATRDARGRTAHVVATAATVEKRRILVVDDSLSARTLERTMLETAGYDVVTATDGAEALQMLQVDARFDLIVSDIEMPNMNGLELTRRLRQSAKLKHLPIVLVTSLASDADRAAGAEAGADEYLVKGRFDQAMLLDTVHRYA